jgi:superfamily I DNA/RNA helicase
VALLIADKFEASLQRLSADEQKAAKLTVYELQTNPASSGLNYEAVKRAKDNRFRSVRVTRDVRMIVHEMGNSITVCYVGRHDDAYDWAARRRLEAHPKTGAAQLVEIRETVREVEVPVVVAAPRSRDEPIVSGAVAAARDEPLFAGMTDEELLGYGVPADWLDDVRLVSDDAALEALADLLPAEATEALWELATGGTPEAPFHAGRDQDPFEHPDAQRRFLLVGTEDELRRALDYPWERWMVFLHPVQRTLVNTTFSGPARVAGSAGTGKTVVALHRAAHLARNHPKARLLTTTFNEALAGALRTKLDLLLDGEGTVRERITVEALDNVALAVHREAFGEPQLVGEPLLAQLVLQARVESSQEALSAAFVQSEWTDVVDEWQLDSWEAYRDVPRLGRKKGLREEQRAQLWAIFERVDAELNARGVLTMSRVFAAATRALKEGVVAPFDFAIIDEAQDIGVPQLRFLAQAAGKGPDGLFFAGDLGQRIFQTPFSWMALGVDVRGRSRTLRVNYRTSHEIRRCADRLLPPQLSDVDGNPESRRGTVSVFAGAPPLIAVLRSATEETARAGAWLRTLIEAGVAPEEVAVFVRSAREFDRAHEAAAAAGLQSQLLDPSERAKPDTVAVGLMESAKGLEFRAVAALACDEDVIPSQARIDEIGDYADLEDTWETERQLLYVACTRARDHLLVTGVAPGSEFLADLRSS